MDRIEFNDLLKKANITKKEMANILEVTYQSINNWGSSQSIPYWVKTWLENYIKAKCYEDIKDKIVEIENLSK